MFWREGTMQAKQFWHFVVVMLLTFGFQPSTAWANKNSGSKLVSSKKQLEILDSKIAKIEQLLAMPEVRNDAGVASVFIQQWTMLSCQRKRLEVQQLAGDIATSPLLDRIEANCNDSKRAEATNKFSAALPTAPK